MQEAADHLADLARVIENLEDVLSSRESLCAAGIQREDEQAITSLRNAPANTWVSPDLEVAARLTAREREVLDLLVQGLSNRLIARSLAISEPTVKNHLHAVFLKLGVADRTQAVAKFLGTARMADSASSDRRAGG
ncbi:LuxR family transcriptional regulator [Actinomadura rubrisoli]|uniref:LuxR family transcriptional regulator n=2 Tax=Actinomadura rubrisoli TaxID=2530368 RepID=A0A4R5CIP5_9ACTN|nr:LuxR family transcriptional regulator [Actinomadura rubrisoli]